MFERFTEQARRTLFFGRYAVTERGGARFDPEHVLLGAIRDPTALLPLQFTPATLNAMEEALVASVAGGEKLATSVEVPFSEDAKAVIEHAAIEADDLGSRKIHTAHLLLGILVKTQGAAFRVLHEAGVTAAGLRSLLVGRSAE